MPLDVFDRFLRPLRRRAADASLPGRPTAARRPSRAACPSWIPAAVTPSAACVDACPSAAISVTAEVWQLDAGRCVFCAACVSACPEDAIRMGDQVELATRVRSSLLVVRDLGKRA